VSPEGVALGYEPQAGSGEGRVWIPLGGSHRPGGLNNLQEKRLVSAVLEARPEPGARLVLLGVDVDGLKPAERGVLRDRIGFLPADGGLLSNLNAWENMVLPIGFHHPERMRAVAVQVNDALRDLGADPRVLLAKLPEKMSLYEKKLTAYVRITLERPDLIVAEEPHSGLDAGERAAVERFPAAYLRSCPGGTFVQLEVAPER
jgi:ABC-type lipoprotein export system ATPase subunit